MNYSFRTVIAIGVIICNSLFVSAQDFWQQMNGPYGGCIAIIKQHPNGSLYAVHQEGVRNVLYCSTDNGERWDALVIPEFVQYINSFAIDTLGYLYMTYMAYAGVLRSDDLGQNWKEVLPADSFATSIDVDRDGGLYAATRDHGLFYSSDQGGSWRQIGSEIRDNVLAHTVVTQDHTLLIVSDNPPGIYRSTDGGKTWAWAVSGLTSTTVNKIMESNNGDLFAGIWGGEGIYRSTNGGTDWFASANGLGYYHNIQDITEDKDGRLFAALDDDRLYRSDDHGDSWYPLTQGLTDRDMISVLSSLNGYLFAGGYYGGVFRSTDNGLSWENKSSCMLNAFVVNLVNYNNSILACVKGKGVERSYDGGNTWTLLNNGLTNGWVRNIAVAPNGYWFVCTWGDGVFRSTNEGLSWQQKNDGIICSSGKTNRSITVNPNGHIFLGMDICPNSIYRSTDNGEHWEPLNTNSFQNKPVGSFAHFGNGDILASSYWLWRSIDNGNNWFKTNCPSGAPGLMAYPDGRIYVASIRSFRKSSDFGNTWISDTICNENFIASDIVVTADSVLYVSGTTNRTNPVYRSFDLGETWTPVTGGMLLCDGQSLLIDSAGYLYTGTSFHSLYRSIERVVGIPTDEPITPDKVILYPNYPNPFNAATTIRFEIPKAGKVKLIVYNILGQEVQVLFDGILPAGSNQVQWNANQYSSGVYLYRLKSDHGEQVRKMLLIK